MTYDLDLWTLAFTLLPWREAQKAACWDLLQRGEPVPLDRAMHADLESLARHLPRYHAEAQGRGARLWLPSSGVLARFLERLPYPVALWVRGTLPPERPTLALVGSRRASGPGRARAHAWGRTLTEAGVGVLSGLARGIDGAAHLGALEAGPTWGILGSGLDHPYPPEHRGLMDRMVAAGGGVITPFPPEARPLPWHFPRRNLLLASWTSGVVLLEGGLRSGSMVTARLALDLGQELWVVPGSPEHPGAEGANALLREGAARVARSPEDLLEDLGAIGWLTQKDLTRSGPQAPSSEP